MSPTDKPLAWLHGEIKTPPFSRAARIEAGFHLRLLQRGQVLGLPHSRPLPSLGPRCHELRVRDADVSWRIVYRIDADASRKKKGTGLGLAIVKHIVNRHRGQMSIKSKPGEGMRVDVFLP